MTSNDITFFCYIAAIAATLLGLTFIALSFFMVDLLTRYDDTALPVLRQRDHHTNRSLRKRGRPESLTDYELLDGDPLVVFIAFSVAVSWNLFLLPLTIGLTTIAGADMIFVGAEMFVFFGILTFSFHIRNKKIQQLNPYLTREELLWGPIGYVGLAVYFIAPLVTLVDIAASHGFTVATDLAVWTLWEYRRAGWQYG